MDKKLDIKNPRFELVNSTLKNHKEVEVVFNYNGEDHKYFIFIKEGKKVNYIKEAEKQFNQDLKSGKVLKTIKTGAANHRPWLIVGASILGIAALTFTGLFAWKMVTNQGTPTPTETECIVTFESNGADQHIDTMKVKPGTIISAPTPEKTDYTFGGWYEKSDLSGNPFNFDNAINKDYTFYAKWDGGPEPTPSGGDPTKPLTFVCLEDNSSINLIYERYENGALIPQRNIDLECQINGGEWNKLLDVKQYNQDTKVKIVDNLKAGDEVCLRGDNKYWTYVDSEDWKADETLSLTTVGRFSVENNIMSLLNKDDFIHAVNTDIGCFSSAFSPEHDPEDGSSDIFDASKLVLPKIDLLPAHYYYDMFLNCSELRFAPHEIMSETASMGYDSCGYMFYNCFSMLVGPNRVGSAEGSIGDEACYYMFYKCYNLNIAPELPSTDFKTEYSYHNMFYNCYNLSYIKVGFGANNVWPETGFVTSYWLDGGAGTSTTIPTLNFYWKGADDPNRTIVPKDVNHVPEGWSIHHY